MRRPWLWIIGGRWDRVAALTRFFTVLAILFLYTGYNQAAQRADHTAARLARLYQQIGTDTARIKQLEDALRSESIPIPPPPTTTSTTLARRPTTTRRAPSSSTSARTSTTTTTTTMPPCQSPTIPVAGTCPSVP